MNGPSPTVLKLLIYWNSIPEVVRKYQYSPKYCVTDYYSKMILIQNLYKVLPHHQPIQKYFSKVFFTIDCPQPIE